ncbi:MAG: GDP-L-fucose synthase [Candidatus Ruthia sp.]|jgi:GDP-L-fucose synthase|nr:GDP-L-fucose synthase [Candidatus Ruthturnera sp.]
MGFKLKKDTKIYVAGHKGLIGSSFIRFFKENQFTNIITRDRARLELTSKNDTYEFFHKNQPEVVILAAGRVGGIVQNKDFPADFIRENLSIQLNVFNASQEYDVKRVIFFGSSCMYPRDTSQPMNENQLCTGHPEPTSIAYASAKYAGIQMCQAINRQNGSVSFIPVIPNSAYGPNDNFDLSSSHVLSALIRRFYEGKKHNKSSVTLWGTGSPRREFIYADDIVSACLMLVEASLDDEDLPINIGVGSDISIKELAEKIRHIVGYSGTIEWDTSKPDGAPRKLLDNSRIKSIGWKSQTDFDTGLESTCQWYLDNIA